MKFHYLLEEGFAKDSEVQAFIRLLKKQVREKESAVAVLERGLKERMEKKKAAPQRKTASYTKVSKVRRKG